ncbi:unnamed protein product [Durusdinium trenchii]|uniref:EB domain-containing protein n=1 Tax=Durusdinium trenchii TaxID=1381693 RepID=A0ABP0K134_9DINO
MSEPVDIEDTLAWRVYVLEKTLTRLRRSLQPFIHDKWTQTDNGQPPTPGRELTPTKLRRQASQGTPDSPCGPLGADEGGVCPSDDTGGTCRIFLCSRTRGPTMCSSGKCFCRPGLCAEDGYCVPPKVMSSDLGSGPDQERSAKSTPEGPANSCGVGTGEALPTASMGNVNVEKAIVRRTGFRDPGTVRESNLIITGMRHDGMDLVRRRVVAWARVELPLALLDQAAKDAQEAEQSLAIGFGSGSERFRDVTVAYRGVSELISDMAKKMQKGIAVQGSTCNAAPMTAMMNACADNTGAWRLVTAVWATASGAQTCTQNYTTADAAAPYYDSDCALSFTGPSSCDALAPTAAVRLCCCGATQDECQYDAGYCVEGYVYVPTTTKAAVNVEEMQTIGMIVGFGIGLCFVLSLGIGCTLGRHFMYVRVKRKAMERLKRASTEKTAASDSFVDDTNEDNDPEEGFDVHMEVPADTMHTKTEETEKSTHV